MPKQNRLQQIRSAGRQELDDDDPDEGEKKLTLIAQHSASFEAKSFEKVTVATANKLSTCQIIASHIIYLLIGYKVRTRKNCVDRVIELRLHPTSHLV